MNPLELAAPRRRPEIPSWGEPYAQVVARMQAAMNDAWNATAIAATS